MATEIVPLGTFYYAKYYCRSYFSVPKPRSPDPFWAGDLTRVHCDSLDEGGIRLFPSGIATSTP